MTPRTSPPVGSSPSTESIPDQSRWASLPAWSRHPVTAGLTLCAMVAVSYYPALFSGFVWDDVILTESRVIHEWSGLWDIWCSPADIQREGHYWPILYTTFWLEHKIWGLEPFGYHVFNVLLYMVNVLLLWVLLRRLAVPGAWAVAAVFAVHPMHVDSVAWVIGRKDLLAGLFCIAAALCWMRSGAALGDSRPDPRDDLLRVPWRWFPESLHVPRLGPYLAAVGLFAAAMLSKSVAVTLPVALLILLWWKHGRVTQSDLCRIGPFFLVALCIALADLSYYTSRRELDLDLGLAERALIAARALWFYAGKLVWPTDLAVVYPLWDIDTGEPLAWGYLVAAVVVVALLWIGRHRLGRAALAGAVLFAVLLSPTLGFVDFGYMQLSFVADRYAYLAGIACVAVLIGAAAYGVSRSPNHLRIGASVVLIAVLAVFGRLTWEQAGIYRDEMSFYKHIISFNPGARSIHRNLANALILAGRPAEAVAISDIEVKQFPGDAQAHNTHGAAMVAVDRLDEAGGSFRRALEIDPDHRSALHNMAKLRRRQERFLESVRWYGEVLDVDPEFAPAKSGMADALFRLGRHQEAIVAYRGALEIAPDHAPAHAGIGYVLLVLKRYEEALDSLALAISLQPESPENGDRHVAMGRAYQALGRMEMAEEQYARALEIDPRNATALDSFAVLCFAQQRYAEALRFYETMIEMGGANARVHANKGAALYYLGRRDEAHDSLERALLLDPSLAEAGFEEMWDLGKR